MDEVLLKSGQWPNIAEPAGSDPAEVMRKYGVKPKQATAATLKRGVCKNIAPRYLDFLCSECGFVHYIDDINCTGDGNDWNYCPECGKKVEQ